jgi:copper(I)-binding protein
MNSLFPRPARFALVALSLLLASCQPSGPKEPIEVSDAWVRLPAVPGRPGAANFTIANAGEADRLLSVTSPRAQRIELHDSGMQGAIAAMVPIKAAEIPANGSLIFAPGGKHAMLFGLDPALKPDDMMPITLTLESGTTVQTSAHVMAAGDEAHGSH